jgi:Protein of unknown function (DUF1517)
MLSFVTLLFALFILHSEAFLINRRPVAVFCSSWKQNTIWKADPVIPLSIRVSNRQIQSNSADDEEKPVGVGASLTSNLRRVGFRKRLKSLWYRLGGPKTVASLILALLCAFGNVSAAAAVTGGRVGGGSFNSRSSSSSAPSRSRPQSYSYSTPRPYTPRYSYPRPMILAPSFPGLSEWYAPSRSTLIVNTRVSAKDIAILTGAGVLLSYGYRNNLQRRQMGEDGGPLGPGYTVGSVTVALQVPDRSADSHNILRQLSQWSMSADTVTRKGLQDLLSSVALELLRNEPFIQSAVAQSKPYAIAGQAEREFQVLSVASQSKVDRLTGTFVFDVVVPELHICLIHFSSLSQ